MSSCDNLSVSKTEVDLRNSVQFPTAFRVKSRFARAGKAAGKKCVRHFLKYNDEKFRFPICNDFPIGSLADAFSIGKSCALESARCGKNVSALIGFRCSIGFRFVIRNVI